MRCSASRASDAPIFRKSDWSKTDVSILPVADRSVDVACVLQVYAYVRDLDAALRDLYRVLKPGGRAIVLDSDMSGIVWESSDRDRMRRILRAWDEHVAWPDLPRVLPRRLRAAGFELLRCEALPFVTLDYHPNTYAFGLAHFIHQFVSAQPGIAADDANAWLAEHEALDAERAFFFGMNRFMFVVRRQ
jgi:arsenite methyltransferase